MAVANVDVALSADDRTADRFVSLLLLFEVLLVGFTWPLWMSIDGFPAVPLMGSLAGLPVIIDQCTTVLLCLSVSVGAVLFLRRSLGSPSKPASRVLVVAVLCGFGLALLNQHRLQPWHWLFLLISLQSLLLPKDSRVPLYQLTLASIYVFAAASRCGPDVDSGMSRQVLTVVMNGLGLKSLMKDATFVFAGCVLMTAVEFLTGVLLLIPRLQRWGAAMAILMHGTLILALSPFGLNHHVGVLVWNAFLLSAAAVLFWPRSVWSLRMQIFHGSVAAKCVAAFVILFPLSGFLAWADNWLSWQVYSARPEVVRVYVHEEAVDQLPPNVCAFVGAPAPLEVWCPLRIDRWSLATTSVPIYPEDRFQLTIAAHLSAAMNDPSMLQVQIDEPSVLSFGKHRSTVLDSDAMQHRLAEFLFNSRQIRRSEW